MRRKNFWFGDSIAVCVFVSACGIAASNHPDGSTSASVDATAASDAQTNVDASGRNRRVGTSIYGRGLCPTAASGNILCSACAATASISEDQHPVLDVENSTRLDCATQFLEGGEMCTIATQASELTIRCEGRVVYTGQFDNESPAGTCGFSVWSYAGTPTQVQLGDSLRLLIGNGETGACWYTFAPFVFGQD